MSKHAPKPRPKPPKKPKGKTYRPEDVTIQLFRRVLAGYYAKTKPPQVPGYAREITITGALSGPDDA